MEMSTSDAAHNPQEPSTAIEDSDGLDSFGCAICWDLLYKPVVLPCGHAFCFWCTHESMDFLEQSRCPLCCQNYTHFPAICKVLDSLVFHATPRDRFKQRESEIHELEVQKETFSPVVERPSSTEDDKSDDPNKKSSCDFSPEDFQCIACKEFLYRPVVLNCGEALCEICIKKLGGSINSCPSCNTPQPALFFKCCLVFQNYLEHLFPEMSKKRESEICADVTPPEIRSHESSVSDDVPLEVHHGAGCDGCGMCPIVGERYRCKDCPEKIGFDLCKVCYERGGILGGRFNQQHKSSHHMERVDRGRRPPMFLPTIYVEEAYLETSENEDEPLSELYNEVHHDL